MHVESRSNKNGWMKIVVIAIVIGIAGFKWYTDSSSENSNASPNVSNTSAESSNANADSDANQTDPQNDQKSETAFAYLRPAGGKNLKSPSGLIYTDSRSGHRADHVLRHDHDIPDRRGPHGVFDANGEEVFELIDEAYQLVKIKSDQVKTQPSFDEKTVYIVDMKREIGYLGGQKGKAENHPKLSSIKLVLGENRVITAYPF